MPYDNDDNRYKYLENRGGCAVLLLIIFAIYFVGHYLIFGYFPKS
jgi:hypothetical protein